MSQPHARSMFLHLNENIHLQLNSRIRYKHRVCAEILGRQCSREKTKMQQQAPKGRTNLEHHVQVSVVLKRRQELDAERNVNAGEKQLLIERVFKLLQAQHIALLKYLHCAELTRASIS
jgi:hypothetical protein